MGGGNVDGFGVKQSVVLLPDGSSHEPGQGAHGVAPALGLKESALRISESAPSVADVVVVLGAGLRRQLDARRGRERLGRAQPGPRSAS